MIKSFFNHPSGIVRPEPWMNERLAALKRMIPRERIAAIDEDLRNIPDKRTAAMVFHRKALLRIHDAARPEAGLVTWDELDRENSFSHLDWSKAQIVFRRRLSD